MAAHQMREHRAPDVSAFDIDRPVRSVHDDFEKAISDGSLAECDDGHEAEVTFKVVNEGTERGKRKLVSSDGFAYTVKRRLGNGSVEWRCSVRGKGNICPVVVKQKGVEFRCGILSHTHPAKPGIDTAVHIKSWVKAGGKQDLFESANNVVKVVTDKLSDPTLPEASRPNHNTLVRICNRARSSQRPRDPSDLSFQLDNAYLESCNQEPFFQSELVDLLEGDTVEEMDIKPNIDTLLGQGRSSLDAGTTQVIEGTGGKLYYLMKSVSLRGKDKLFDNQGYSYTIHYRSTDDTWLKKWRCSIRNTKIKYCPASVFQRGGQFSQGSGGDHIHPPNKNEIFFARLYVQVEQKVHHQPHLSVTEIVDEVVRDNFMDGTSPTHSLMERLRRKTNYTRAKQSKGGYIRNTKEKQKQVDDEDEEDDHDHDPDDQCPTSNEGVFVGDLLNTTANKELYDIKPSVFPGKALIKPSPSASVNKRHFDGVPVLSSKKRYFDKVPCLGKGHLKATSPSPNKGGYESSGSPSKELFETTPDRPTSTKGIVIEPMADMATAEIIMNGRHHVLVATKEKLKLLDQTECWFAAGALKTQQVTKIVGSQLIHGSRVLCGVDKATLAKLRKKTGFSISHCKKALEIHNNDLIQAEAWMEAEAQAKGWEQATKLSGRKTSQGLVGVHIEGQTAAMLEVNCETDFVSRNDKFRTLVAKMAKDCWMPLSTTDQEVGLVKEMLNQDEVKAIRTKQGSTLGDLLALAIGTIGENMTLPRATRLTAGSDTTLVGYCHPSTIKEQILTGGYGVILAVRAQDSHSDVLKQLCVHVVGMNPKAIGSADDPKCENPEEESLLVHQEFLSDQTKTVGEVLEDEGIDLVDFIRFEVGGQNEAESTSQ